VSAGDAALRFHEATSHSWESVRRLARPLDWASRPYPFKSYPIEPEPLPEELERLLRLGAGVVRTRDYPGGITYDFRTYASAGALYPVEVYVARPDGLFHFHAKDLALRRLGTFDIRAELANAAADDSLARSAAVLVLTGLLSRTAWKYGPRGYRHLFWDAGTMLANLLPLAPSPVLVTGFVDAAVPPPPGEIPLALFRVGSGPHRRVDGFVPVSAESPPMDPLYPEVEELHEASTLLTQDEVKRYHGDWKPPQGPDPLADLPLDEALRRRVSTREFAPSPISAEAAADLLARAMGPIPADVPPCCEPFVIAHRVEGLDPGVYRFRAPDVWELTRSGDFRRQSGYLCLEQPLGELAAAVVFFMADLAAVLERHGDRGYRWAQLEGGIRTGRVYAAASARGLGATGTTFYDADVSRFLAPGTTLAPMLAVAFGSRAYASSRA
jgi:SagB-type dehydrogenase family enzyme